jgi:septum formation inhibitor MinC
MADETSSSNQSTIEVDDAAAYFGATTSSDMLHTLMSMPREQAMVQFFEILSDIVLSPGDFDFEAASERMQCEGGEIYYLVAGHLALMSMPDPLLDALGLPNSSGDVMGARLASITTEQEESLTQLADPMRMMKIFAVAHQTGQADEIMKYMNTLQGHLDSVEPSLDVLVSINKELDAALDVRGHILPLPSLASGSAAPAELVLPKAAPPVVSSPKTVVPLPSTAPPSVPIPTTPTPIPEPSPAPVAVPLPSESVQLPVIEAESAPEETVNVENEKQVARATQNAFAGAFDIGIGNEDATPSVVEQQAEETMQVTEPAPLEESAQDEPEEEEFVSAAEHFIAADEDSSGALSVEELAQATGATLEEASELHAEADTDGDGVVTLSEFISSPAGERSVSLPKPVAPVRKPLGGGQQPAQAPQPVTQRPQPLPQQPQQPQQNWQQQPQQPQQNWQQQPQQPQQNWQQQPQQPQQNWQQQPQAPVVQPTIRSGVHCRNCGIGLDPYWRFCPVCGQQNMGY